MAALREQLRSSVARVRGRWAGLGRLFCSVRACFWAGLGWAGLAWPGLAWAARVLLRRAAPWRHHACASACIWAGPRLGRAGAFCRTWGRVPCLCTPHTALPARQAAQDTLAAAAENERLVRQNEEALQQLRGLAGAMEQAAAAAAQRQAEAADEAAARQGEAGAEGRRQRQERQQEQEGGSEPGEQPAGGNGELRLRVELEEASRSCLPPCAAPAPAPACTAPAPATGPCSCPCACLQCSCPCTAVPCWLPRGSAAG